MTDKNMEKILCGLFVTPPFVSVIMATAFAASW